MGLRHLRCLPLLLLAALGCSAEPTDDQALLLDVPETERWRLPNMGDAAYVIRTEGNVPHIYARGRYDLARVEGFVLARDRFFMMDLARRLGLGTLSGLFGDVALPSDQEARGIGLTYVADQMMAGLTPELAAVFDAFAEGVNTYIALVADNTLQAPSELELAKGILGTSQAADLMEPFDRRSVAAIYAVVLYQSSYETGDVGNAATAAQLSTLFEGAPFQELRRQGAIVDLWSRIEPLFQVRSAAGFGVEQGPASAPQAHSASAPPALLERLSKRLEAIELRFLRNDRAGFGSNAWAVSGAASTDGSALIAGDGHLSLAVPSLLYQIGLDTRVFGGGATHQLGMVIPGMVVMPIGTNGRVGWSQTQLMGDITDWYAEELKLNAEGAPVASVFRGETKPLVRIEERFEVADRPVLGSVGRTEVWPRYVTFDGRFIADIEGREAAPDEQLVPGETLLNLQGDFVVPGDLDGDGIVSAISFDYTGFDAGEIVRTIDALGHAGDVHAFREATRGLVAYSQNFAVADSSGNAYYTSYQAVPCRGYLDRNPDGSWADGADPTLLLDGTRYGGFRIPVVDGRVDEAAGADDPSACVVPHADMPAALNPERGYVLTANNDPGGLSFDGSLTNDTWYIGGPWDVGYRADTIDRELARAVAEGAADIERMAAIQANVDSRLGEMFSERLLASIDHARALGEQASRTPDEQRVVDLYQADQAAIDEGQSRLVAWQQAGFQARSGVKTFYNPDVTDAERADAVATMLFNAWIGRVVSKTFDDEGLPGVWKPGGTDGRLRALHRLLEGRGADNPLQLASFSSDTGESIFFDVLDTPEVETSHEIILGALVDALAFLRSEPTEPGEGGFGSDDMDGWLWGLRHAVRFESLLGEYLGEDSAYGAITSRFAINTSVLPLDADIGPGDPRRGLVYFPRHGDQDAVDAANPGLSGERFSYGSGPVMRMVMALKGDTFVGRNIIPGGQSGLIDSPYFADQARLWLGNHTIPMRLSPADVAAGAFARETYIP